MTKLVMMFVGLVGFGACDMQMQDEAPVAPVAQVAPVEQVAPLSGGDGVDDQCPEPDGRPVRETRWKCNAGDPVCYNLYSFEVVPDCYCKDTPKPTGCGASK